MLIVPVMAIPELPSFDVPFEEILRTMKKGRYKRAVLQVPEGLKRGAFSIASELERRTGCSFIVDGGFCYGACDHAGERAQLIGAQAVVHLGHSDIPSMERNDSVPVHFFRVEMKADLRKLRKGIKEAIRAGLGKRVGLATTAQHIIFLDAAKAELEKAGIEVRTGPPSKRETYQGQVLGCSFASVRAISDSVDTVLFIGSGRFHPLGILQATGKGVLSLDPLSGTIEKYGPEELEMFLRRRWGAVQKAMERISQGEGAGIIVCYKPGQRRKDLAGKCTKICKDAGVKAHLAVLDELSPMKLKALGPKLWISTACPRLALEDVELYSREDITLITPMELEIVLGIERWEDYRFDEEW